jgi:HEAT repeat protein
LKKIIVIISLLIFAPALSGCAGATASPAKASPPAFSADVCKKSLRGKRGAIDAVDCYKKYLLKYPTQARELVAAIAANKIDQRLHPAAFNALGLVGGPEAGKALRTAAQSEKQSRMNRARAIIAMQSSDAPDSASVETLFKLSQVTGQSEDSIISVTALLMLAAISKKVDPSTVERISAEVKGRLLAEQSADGLAAAISAAGNLGDADLLTWYYRSSPNLANPLKERLAAALAQTQSAVAEPTLLSLLDDEDTNVRIRAAEGLADLIRRGNTLPSNELLLPSGKTIRGVIERLEHEPEAAVRVHLVHVLGLVSTKYAVAAKALGKQLLREKDQRVLQAIGKYPESGINH